MSRQQDSQSPRERVRFQPAIRIGEQQPFPSCAVRSQMARVAFTKPSLRQRIDAFWMNSRIFRRKLFENLRRSIAAKECYCTNEVFLWPSIVFQPSQLARAFANSKAWKHPEK
jgi:hypothetical protein